MFGLDEYLASLSDGASVLAVLGVAVLLGLRHAGDPDHVTAVSTLIAAGRERTARRAGLLGVSWGLGHATTLFVFGLPFILFRAALPARALQGAEVAIGLVIVALAAWLLLRWRRGLLHVHAHRHDDVGEHVHLHGHRRGREAADHRDRVSLRSPLQSYAIGLVHGVGGSAGVSILLLASIEDTVLAVAGLVLFAAFTAASMGLVSAGFGATVSSRPVQAAFARLAPLLGVTSLAFGVWYVAAALELAPYYF